MEDPALPVEATGPLHVALRFAYDGSLFDAYARNPELRTVEGELLAALAHEGYVPDSIKTGSRTDAGVSALENVCRVTLQRPHLKGLVPAVQRHCPRGLWITGAAAVGARWNPRHARLRRYRYDAMARGEELAPMQEACTAFVGTHDMRAFARLEEGRRPERDIFAFRVEASGAPSEDSPEAPHALARPEAWRPEGWVFTVESNGYLWNQVRRMVSAVLSVGRADATVADVRESLATGNPHKEFRVAAAQGLLLERVVHDGLEWDPAAGRLGAHLLPQATQEARSRLRLLEGLGRMSPWPDGLRR